MFNGCVHKLHSTDHLSHGGNNSVIYLVEINMGEIKREAYNFTQQTNCVIV